MFQLWLTIFISSVLDFGMGNGNSLYSSGDYNLNAGLKPSPVIVTKSKQFRVPEDHTVTLPCDVDFLGDHVVVWRRGNEVLSAGLVLTTKDERFHLRTPTRSVSGTETHNRLELRNIESKDAGDYVCQISIKGGGMLQVDHTVEVLVPPRVRADPSDGKVIVKKGSEVTLRCEASGNPVPNVVWSREHDLLPEGSVSGQNQHGYTIRQVDRYDAGRYTCTADNGVGSPATAHIALEVLYEPEIDVEAEKVHSGVGKEAHLTCIVHGQPRPQVRWYKEQVLLSPTSKIRMEDLEGSNRHTLILRGLTSQADFGNYSCVAENSLGSSKRHIEVHGRPTPAVFRNKPHQNSKNSFRLVWTVDSYTRIEEYRLLYRQIKPFHPENLSYHPDSSLMSTNVHVTGSDWTNIIIPGDSIPTNRDLSFHHEKSFLLTDLLADAQYECLVQAKNQYGWSEASRIHRFYTHSNYASEARDLGWTSGSDTSTSPSLKSFKSILCFLLASLAQHFGWMLLQQLK